MGEGGAMSSPPRGQQQRILERRRERGVDLRCSACRLGASQGLDGSVAETLRAADQADPGREGEAGVVRFAALVCDRCGHLVKYELGALGLPAGDGP
jgi:hypothetical protein